MPLLTKPDISIADARHIDALMAVMAGSFDPLFGEAWSASQLAGTLQSDGSFARKASAGAGRAVGFTLARAASVEVELLLIAVETQSRSNGIGRLLIEQVFADATVRGASEVFLEVRETNVAARQLYQSAGFVDVGRRPDYYAGADGGRFSAITMRRKLFD